jgi:hypothetical protein
MEKKQIYNIIKDKVKLLGAGLAVYGTLIGAGALGTYICRHNSHPSSNPDIAMSSYLINGMPFDVELKTSNIGVEKGGRVLLVSNPGEAHSGRYVRAEDGTAYTTQAGTGADGRVDEISMKNVPKGNPLETIANVGTLSKVENELAARLYFRNCVLPIK